MWVSMCFSRALDSYFIVKMPPYSLPKIATRGVRPGYDRVSAGLHSSPTLSGSSSGTGPTMRPSPTTLITCVCRHEGVAHTCSSPYHAELLCLGADTLTTYLPTERQSSAPVCPSPGNGPSAEQVHSQVAVSHILTWRCSRCRADVMLDSAIQSRVVPPDSRLERPLSRCH